jgi:hypothetical protein
VQLYRDSEGRTIAQVARQAHPGKPVIFVGLDGADWQLLDRYIASGAMPNLAALVSEGAGGVLTSLHPPLSPLVWTTMMTGASPVDHRILDFTRFNPLDGREEPITSDERRLPAVWNMATAAGRRVAVIGLWATFPAEAVNGLIVSDRLIPSLLRTPTDAPGVVYPSERAAWARAASSSWRSWRSSRRATTWQWRSFAKSISFTRPVTFADGSACLPTCERRQPRSGTPHGRGVPPRENVGSLT